MAVEYRGVKGLVVAEVLTDTESAYTTGTVHKLAPVAEIAKTVETSADAHYYDNKAAIVIESEGPDTVTFTIAVPEDEVFALITGRTYDSTAKRFIESERVERYFAVGYVIGEVGQGEDERYVWRYKGTFAVPDETSQTVNDSTDANNVSLVYTGIYTEHEFANGKGTGITGAAKAMYIRKSANVATEATFFAVVATPDTVFPAYALTITEDNHTQAIVTRGGQLLENNAIIFAGDVLTITATEDGEDPSEQLTLTVNGTAFTSGNTYTVVGDTVVETVLS